MFSSKEQLHTHNLRWGGGGGGGNAKERKSVIFASRANRTSVLTRMIEH